MNTSIRWVRGGWVLVMILGLASAPFAVPEESPLTHTPLEANAYIQLPSSAEINSFLRTFATGSPLASLIPLGRSAGDRPLQALLVSEDPAFLHDGHSGAGKLIVLLVGSQHGTEPSGAEALQRVARELVGGTLRSYLHTMDFVLIVNGNPDGRDLHRRVNANGVNLSTDYVLLSQPESRAVVAILQRFQPHVVLDVHESALLKKSTLGAQGFLTNFEAQFEIANNPNVESALQVFSREYFLPTLLEAVDAQDLPARHYIGEITDVNQPITHGGLSLRNLRNYAGLQGALSVLVENRLDPPGEYPTPRNIAARIAKQFLCISAFLAQCQREREAILEHVAVARSIQLRRDGDPVLHLTVAYARDPQQPQITLPLRRRDTGELVQWTFEYHPRVVANEPLLEPLAYLVTGHQRRIAELLDRHEIPYTRIEQPGRLHGTRQRIEAIHRIPKPRGGNTAIVRVSERQEAIQLTSGDLRIDLSSSSVARLVPLLLDPRSSSSVFQVPAFSELLVEGADFFIVRVDRVKKRGFTLIQQRFAPG